MVWIVLDGDRFIGAFWTLEKAREWFVDKVNKAINTQEDAGDAARFFTSPCHNYRVLNIIIEN